ncbi:MAG: polysaccharide deacetylase family protein [bacterium]
MLLILSSSISNRLHYITRLLMNEMLGVEVRLTTSADEFTAYPGPKICYSREPLADGVFIQASGLLFENEICLQEVTSFDFNGVPVLFQTDDPRSALPFDPFAAAFYMVSRYEEYLPHKKDGYGRYQAKESIAWTAGFLETPVVHLWAGMVEEILGKNYPGLTFTYPRYRYVPTIDIDHAWCYKGRTFTRTMGGFGRSLIRGQFRQIAERTRVLAGLSADPYDSYSFINAVHEPGRDHPLFFVLFADYGTNDNNVTVSGKQFHRLLRDLDESGNVGIHPSLSSNKHLLKLNEEIDGLSRVLRRAVTLSRQHFLKISLPRTYRLLVQSGITDDFSMGYASQPGFRAGIAMPFPFYDLAREEITGLIIHPVCLMDVTLKDYLRLNRVESLEKIKAMIQTIKAVNGEYVSLWHNESLGGTGRWEGWQEIYAEMVKLASN